MHKRTIITLTVIVCACVTLGFAVNESIINLDFIGQGTLNSVTIYDEACYTTICENGAKEMIITSSELLKSLETTFFYKVKDVFHMTKESGNLKFFFNYERKTIIFEVGIDNGFDNGMIYYIQRKAVYHIDNYGLATLKNLFQIAIKEN